MVDALDAGDRLAQGAGVAQVAVEALDGQPVDGGVVGAGAEQAAHLLAVGEQPADQVRAEMTARTGEEQFHARLLPRF